MHQMLVDYELNTCLMMNVDYKSFWLLGCLIIYPTPRKKNTLTLIIINNYSWFNQKPNFVNINHWDPTKTDTNCNVNKIWLPLRIDNQPTKRSSRTQHQIHEQAEWII